MVAFLYGLVPPTTVYGWTGVRSRFQLQNQMIFQKGALWSPQTLCAAEQVAAGVISPENNMAFLRLFVLVNILSIL